MMKKFLILGMISILTVSGISAQEENNSNDLLDGDILGMSLEEIMQLEVTVGSISGTSTKKLPLSVTTITKEQIELSNAQNLLNLIQIYVPGASYWDNVEGQMVALRGITSSRNNKLLLVVDGKVLNQKAHTGVTTELYDWDMEDISKVEIIRGPGSVTYGPGAISGVINIVTKSAGEEKGLKVSAKYMSSYNNKTVSASYGFEKENISGYFHAGIASTEGFTPEGILLSNDTIGKRGNPNATNKGFVPPATNIGRNMNNKPDMKFLASIKFLKENTFTARYTSYNATTHGYFQKQSQKVIGHTDSGEPILDKYDDFAMADNQQLTISLKNNHKFNDINLNVESEIAFIGGDYMRSHNEANNYDKKTFDSLSVYHDVNSYDYIKNLRHNYSENAFMARSMGVYKINDKHKFALGAEVISTKYGKGWGDKLENFRMSDSRKDNIIISDENSNILASSKNYDSIDTTTSVANEDYFFVGDGWRTTDVGLVAEANLSFSPLFNMMLSGRLDKNTYFDWVFSPRIAFISELNNNNILKLIFQQSKRINNSELLYIGNQLDIPRKEEVIYNTELIYTKLIGNSMLNISAYYNNQDVNGFNIKAKETGKIAKAESAGLEIDYRVQLDNQQGGINHAFNKTINFELHEGVSKTLISYADYKEKFNGIDKPINVGSGNNMRDIANHATKLYYDRFFKQKKYTFHTEMAVLWGYPGNKDVQNAATKAELSQKDAIAIYNLYEKAFNDYDFFKTSIFWNATVKAKVLKNLTLNAGVQNILGSSGNAKIYGLTGGGLKNINYREIPRTYTFKLTYKL